MKKSIRIISIVLSVLMIAGVFSFAAVTSSAAPTAQSTASSNEYGLPENVEGGLILHCWCWSFNSIKDNMEQIAKAGYAAVQTSPINKVLEGDDGGMKIYGSDADGKWYYQYQPVDYTIGNYQLGTEAEFKAMCEVAHSYGVKVIVDVVANHTTGYKAAVADSLKNIEGGLYHNYNGGSDPDSRKSVTQWYNGLPDVNTQNPNYQQLILNFLKTAVADGADGFRYDTAKHIELPDDDASYAGNFWPTVLDNGSSFQYGEVLQGSNSTQIASSRIGDYAKIMHVTASSYGYTIRKYLYDTSGLSGTDADGASGLSGYGVSNVDYDRLVTWVESHDTYANGDRVYEPGLSSYWLTNEQIRRGWAIITARGDTTSLFFSRPKNSSPSDDSDRDDSTIWGDNVIGASGDDNYFNPETVAINRFHNAMIGEPSTMVNLRTDIGRKQFIMISRGTRGAVIVNSGDKELVVDHTTALAEGTYTDVAHGGKFISKDGKLTGTVAPGQVVVLWDDPDYYRNSTEPETEPVTEPEPAPRTTVKLSKTSASVYRAGTVRIKATVKNGVGKTTYKSSNSSVAKVSTSGKVTALKKGTATITVKNNGVSKSFKVTVKNPSLKKTKTTLKVKGKYTISIVGKVGKATFKSSNKKIATVTSAGKIVAKKKGSATITVSTNNGFKLKFTVKVK